MPDHNPCHCEECDAERARQGDRLVITLELLPEDVPKVGGAMEFCVRVAEDTWLTKWFPFTNYKKVVYKSIPVTHTSVQSPMYDMKDKPHDLSSPPHHA